MPPKSRKAATGITTLSTRWSGARGLDFAEDLFQPFVLHFDLNARPQAAMIASLEPRDIAAVPDLYNAELARRKSVGGKAGFCRRSVHREARRRHSIIAGYPLVCRLGPRHHDFPSRPHACARLAANCAKGILEDFSHWLKDGMLPNRFPDAGGAAASTIPWIPGYGISKLCGPCRTAPAIRLVVRDRLYAA